MGALVPLRRLGAFTTFDTSSMDSQTIWDALFAPDYDLHAHGWRAGDEIVDAYTDLSCVVLCGLTPTTPLTWGSHNPAGLVRKIASAPVVRRRLVRFAPGDLCAHAAVAGNYDGISLNDAGVGEAVYVIPLGSYIVEVSQPVSPGASFTVGPGGRMAPVTALTDAINGTALMGPVTLGPLMVQLGMMAGITGIPGSANTTIATTGFAAIKVLPPVATATGGAVAPTGFAPIAVLPPVATATGGAVADAGFSAVLVKPPVPVFPLVSNYVPGVVIDLNADYGLTLNGPTAVAAWADQSGNANHATQGTAIQQPHVIAGGQNGRNTIRFAPGFFEHLRVASSLTWQLQQFSMWCVLKYNGVSAFQQAMNYSSDPNWAVNGFAVGKSNQIVGNTNISFWVVNYLTHEVEFVALGTTNWHVILGTYDAVTVRAYMDNVAGVPTALAGPIPLPAIELFIGAGHVTSTIANYPVNADIAACGMANHELTLGERTALFDNFDRYYGI